MSFVNWNDQNTGGHGTGRSPRRKGGGRRRGPCRRRRASESVHTLARFRVTRIRVTSQFARWFKLRGCDAARRKATTPRVHGVREAGPARTAPGRAAPAGRWPLARCVARHNYLKPAGRPPAGSAAAMPNGSSPVSPPGDSRVHRPAAGPGDGGCARRIRPSFAGLRPRRLERRPDARPVSRGRRC